MWRHRAESKSLFLDIPVKIKNALTVDIYCCTLNLGWWKDKKNRALKGHKKRCVEQRTEGWFIKNHPSACRTGHWRQNHEEEEEEEEDNDDDDNDDKMHASVTSNMS